MKGLHHRETLAAEQTHRASRRDDGPHGPSCRVEVANHTISARGSSRSDRRADHLRLGSTVSDRAVSRTLPTPTARILWALV